ncbi:MAG: hypothetical protein OEV68_02340, partial [candidate division Zixibacteria bacterium]|nr:hypothetical protein [candidate division Zixibacteria bacterium]
FDWGRATIVTNVPQPDSAGKREAMIVTGLAADSSYSFAIRAADEEDNWSPVSNVIAATTWVSTDSVPPSAIVDLIVIDSATNHISLSWTAPGDDSDSGTARAYEVRFSVGSSLDWEAARSVDEVAPPQSAGTPETLIVPDLEEETAYAFGIKSVDENNNWSGLSNVVSLTTPVDTIPPNAITDLQVTDSTHTSVTLTWTASGDDGASGTAHVYSLRYSQSPIDDATWAAATEVAGLSAPQGSGSVETFTVTDLGNDVIYYFAIRTADDKLNWSPLAENLEVYLPGPLVWQKSYGGADTDEANAVTLANDGGIVIAGKTNSSGAGDFDGYVVKIDSDGDVVWEKTFGGAAEDQFNDIIATPDGGFAAVGFTKSAGAGGNDGWLVKLNSSGTKVWERTHGADSHESFLEVLPAGDGGYILAGYGMGGAYVVKTDAAGDSVWADVYFRSSNCNGHSSSGVYNSVAQMPDGSIMIAWTAWIRRFWPPEDCVPEVHCFLTKLDVQQNEVWTKLSHGDWFGGYAEWMTGTMVSTSSGGFAMAGGENTKFFASWDTGGNQLWRQNSGHWMVDPVDLAQLSDGSFIPVGYTRGSFGQAWFGLVNASGELVDQFLIGGDAADRFHAVTELDDGSIIAVGYTRSFSESTDLYVVKLSP